jgi:hypothetical protein
LELRAHRALSIRRLRRSLASDGNFRPLGAAAYDKSMAKPNRPVRWSLWLATGVLFGLVLGFAFGLARPRVRK